MSCTNLSLYSVKGVVLLDSEGKRILGKYYSRHNNAQYSTIKEQLDFEKSLFDKTKKTSGEIILFDGNIVLFKHIGDTTVYVIGSPEENELILSSVLNAFYDTLTLNLEQVDHKSILGNLDLVFLALDECIDDGIIVETDPHVISGRISKRTSDTIDLSNINEQTILSAYQQAKEKLASTLLK